MRSQLRRLSSRAVDAIAAPPAASLRLGRRSPLFWKHITPARDLSTASASGSGAGKDASADAAGDAVAVSESADTAAQAFEAAIRAARPEDAQAWAAAAFRRAAERGASSAALLAALDAAERAKLLEGSSAVLNAALRGFVARMQAPPAAAGGGGSGAEGAEGPVEAAEAVLDGMRWRGVRDDFETLGLFVLLYALGRNVCKLREAAQAMRDPRRGGDPLAKDPALYAGLLAAVEKANSRHRSEASTALLSIARHWKAW
eukprot:tig00000857_g4949.t1